jgi:hypothetical protein
MKLKFLQIYSLINKLLILFVLLAFAISCSSVKINEEKNKLRPSSIDTTTNITPIQNTNLKKNISNFEFKGDLDIAMNEDEYSGVFRGVSYQDSILFVDFYGPFGIDVGRIEINKNTIRLINKWHKKYFEYNLDSITLQQVNPLELANSIFLAESIIDSVIFQENHNVISIDTGFNKIKIKFDINKNDKSVTNYNITTDSLSTTLTYNNLIEFQSEKVPNSINLLITGKKINMKLSSIEFTKHQLNKVNSNFNLKSLKKVNNFNKLFN